MPIGKKGSSGQPDINPKKSQALGYREAVARAGEYVARSAPDHARYQIWSNPKNRGGANYGRVIGEARSRREAERKVRDLAEREDR